MDMLHLGKKNTMQSKCKQNQSFVLRKGFHSIKKKERKFYGIKFGKHVHEAYTTQHTWVSSTS